MSQEWRPVVGFEDYYEVSSDGVVRSLPSHKAPMRGGGGKGGFPLKPWISHNGYYRISLWVNGKRTHASVHELVLEAFIGARPPGLVACHNNGIRTDNRAINLRWDSMRNNHLDKKQHGTWQAGEKHPRARLTNTLVRLIRSSTKTTKQLARDIGVSETCVHLARARQTWKHVE